MVIGQRCLLQILKSKVLLSLNQAGLVEKFTDAMVWLFLPNINSKASISRAISAIFFLLKLLKILNLNIFETKSKSSLMCEGGYING